MVGIITQSSSLNSFWSICYCFITLGVHTFTCYTAISRYKESDSRAWPGAGGVPVESAALLGLTILSLILMPIFCVTCFIKVGNLANDGIKLGRDHALGGWVESTKDCSVKNVRLRRVWHQFCPVSQTLHVVAAFLLLLPETLLTAVEVKYEYKPTEELWRSELDFLYPSERSFMSDVKSIVNISEFSNATHVFLPTPRTPSDGRANRENLGIAFINFCFALTTFMVRYASVFWYTNKALTTVFALQLLSMVLTSIFSFNSFSILYRVCYNQRVYPNVDLSINCSVDILLYLFGSTILMVSTMAVFEYGSHYFNEKFKIVERHHNPESYVKQTVIVNSGCQGYVPHSCAMAALIALASCKGPLLYDLVALMRVTGDSLLLSGVVCEVCYMVLWVVLWFGLTVKQQWQFRILDYVPLRQPMYGLSDETASVRSSQLGHGDGLEVESISRKKRFNVGKENYQQRYSDPLPYGMPTCNEEPSPSDVGTDESDTLNSAADMVLDLEGNPIADLSSPFRRFRNRRHGAQRVTFDESVRSKGSVADEFQSNSLPRQGAFATRVPEHNPVNVTADVHSAIPPVNNQIDGSSQEVLLRRKSNPTDSAPFSKEYRNSIRNKCGEYYSSTNNLSPSTEDPATAQYLGDPLPTLMSSFRDKVRESSIAASNFREREKSMLENYNYSDPPPVHQSQETETDQSEKRRCIAISDEELGDGKGISVLEGDNRLATRGGDASKEVNTSSLGRKKQSSSTSSDEGHRSSFANTTLESSDASLPPLMEDIQLGRVRSNSGGVTVHKEHRPHHNMVGGRPDSRPLSRPLKATAGYKTEIGRRDSANYSLTSSQDTSSNESDHGHGLCSQV